MRKKSNRIVNRRANDKSIYQAPNQDKENQIVVRNSFFTFRSGRNILGCENGV